ncbi:hypothetical protein [Leeuwenhoekiella marinoflava]|uniref:Quinol oxidase subunit 4 n=2 Tax=Leeuwenhoekiella marinoflava TaxID=988 RepID=A0A4Q0PKL9_9FLAO|nr:hypothetical protein [Leeuwenhoekiella marinoflava]RXG28484.1 hypothetical protein DSL99_2486 [Leeuwenhoekiella marinoflava]SHF52881.1 hypothetical protein SAMN02745246_02775 [Leeuwenhoekiella marinoflava DSM 3653]
MKKLILILSLGSFLLSATSCSSTYRTTSRNSPPGQVKKAYGAKSAKAFAPGQEKKNKRKKKY